MKLGKADSTAAVDQFMAALEHPHKSEVARLRLVVLGAEAGIHEGVKWNAPSFRNADNYFATTHLRAKRGIGLILHRGAKVREAGPERDVPDPAQLLQWLAKDRAMVSITDIADLEAKTPALQALLKAWSRAA